MIIEKFLKQTKGDWQYPYGEYGERSSRRQLGLTEKETSEKRFEHEGVNHVLSGGSVLSKKWAIIRQGQKQLYELGEPLE